MENKENAGENERYMKLNKILFDFINYKKLSNEFKLFLIATEFREEQKKKKMENEIKESLMSSISNINNICKNYNLELKLITNPYEQKEPLGYIFINEENEVLFEIYPNLREE